MLHESAKRYAIAIITNQKKGQKNKNIIENLLDLSKREEKRI